jgi:hypothetical protein
MSDRFLGAPMLVVGQMQGGHGQQARAGWVFDVVHVLMSAGRVAADGLVRLRRHLTRAGQHQRNGAVLASPPAWRPSCADAGHHDLDDHRHARGYAHGAGPAARTAIPAVSRPAMPAAVLAVGTLLPAYFTLAAIPWLVRAIDPGRRMNDRTSRSASSAQAPTRSVKSCRTARTRAP